MEMRVPTGPDWHFTLTPGDVLRTLGRRWRSNATILVVCLALGALYLLIVTPKYEARMTIVPYAPPAAAGGGGQSAATPALLGQSTSGPPEYVYFRQLLASEVVAARMIDTAPEIMPVVFSREWREEGWRSPGGILPTINATVNSLFGIPGWAEPDPYRLARYIAKNINVVQLGTDPMHEISFRHSGPTFALHFVQTLRSAAEETLKSEQSAVLAANAEHLRDQLRTNQVVAYREALALMLAQVETVRATMGDGLPHGAKVLQPPSVSPLPVEPKALLVLIGAVLAALLLALVIAVLRPAP